MVCLCSEQAAAYTSTNKFRDTGRKAKVTALEVSTGLVRSDVTNDEGEYSIPSFQREFILMTVEGAQLQEE